MTGKEMFHHISNPDSSESTIRVDPERHSEHRVPPNLFGKFTEHLGWNIYKGIDAQILYNPTFGRWWFRPPRATVDGGYTAEHDFDRIDAQIEEHAEFRGFPDSSRLREAYENSVAFWWMRVGNQADVSFSPDTGRAGDRAQRMDVHDASPQTPRGAFQWTYLPLHRTAEFEFDVAARAVRPTTLSLEIASVDADGTPTETVVSEEFALHESWTTRSGTLEVPVDEVEEDELFAVKLTTVAPANVVFDHVRLYPDDHVKHADPEIVEYFRNADLPVHRWPGGNFVSGYDWRDGVGPIESRPTRPNPAWGGVESNLFGTNEFLAFCEAIDCEPLICVNAGDGTPKMAAAWIEYCNGDPDETEMGRLRAEHGHPEPYDVTMWEVGNELYGKWQVNWTTPAGNADRFRRFEAAMEAVDPSIEVLACGSRDGDWNDRLISEGGDSLRTITDHPLVGGTVGSDTAPDELFHAFMGSADRLGREYRELRERMREAGIDDPALAITEIQLFAGYDGEREFVLPPAWNRSISPSVQTAEDVPVPSKKTISEALFDVTIIHECIRMGNFVELITHSATVNHGAGLQKWQERVWADPSYYGRVLASKLADSVPIGVTVTCDTIATAESSPEADPIDDFPALDAMAVHSPDESQIVVSLVHRASNTGPMSVTIDVDAFDTAAEAELVALSGETMDAENTLAEPERVVPETSTVNVRDGSLTVTVSPYSVTRLTVDCD